MKDRSNDVPERRRNTEAELFRLIFSLLIVDFHVMHFFQSGYLAVEFFFILSGFFAIAQCERISREPLPGSIPACAVRMTLKKFAPIFLFTIPATLLQYLEAWAVACRAGAALPQGGFVTALGALYEVLVLQTGGLIVEFKMVPLWYLSALLLALPVFYAAALKFREGLVWLLAPLSTAFIHGYLCTSFGTIRHWGKWMGFAYTSVLRVWAGLCLGAMAYQLAAWLKRLRFTRLGALVLLAVQYGCLAVAVCYFYTEYDTPADFAIVGLLWVFAAILLSGQTRLAVHLRAPLGWVADYSLALYATHVLVRNFVQDFWPAFCGSKLLVFGIILAAAALYMGFIRLLRKIPVKQLARRWLLCS